MARPISWLPRLYEIRKSVTNSVRSHYTRAELQQLFEIQPRAASRLLESLPTVKVGTAYLVKREDLISFLNQMHESEDAHAVLGRVKEEKGGVSRQKLRNLVRHDIEPATLESVPPEIALERGLVQIRFDSTYRLVECLWALASILQGEGLGEFVERYEPRPPAIEDEGAADVRALFAELDEMEAAHAVS